MPGREDQRDPGPRRRARSTAMSTISNEAIFSAGTPSSASSSTAARSNGLEKKAIPRSRAWSAELGLPLAGQGDRVEQLLRAALVVEVLEPGRLRRVEVLAAVGLELDRVGARVGGDVDQLARHPEVAVVVGAGLGDHVRGLTGPDRPAADLERALERTPLMPAAGRRAARARPRGSRPGRRRGPRRGATARRRTHRSRGRCPRRCARGR